MKMTLTTYQIADMLTTDREANWSYKGAMALAEYLEEFEANTGEEIEFDAVAIRCDFSEYASLREWAEEYHGNPTHDTDEEIREFIQGSGQLIEFDGGIIVSAF